MRLHNSKTKIYIEKSQIYLIKKTKFFFQDLKKKNINLAKSSFCYLSSYGNTLGAALLNFWIKKNFFNLLFFVLKNILSISSLKYLKSTKVKYTTFNKLIVTWGRKEDFKNGKFIDSFLNINSGHIRNALFVVIYSGSVLPRQIPANVAIVYFSSNKKNILYFIKSLIFFLKKNNWSYTKFIHYFSYNTQYAEIVLFFVKDLINKNEIKKIIMPYESQIYQNLIFSEIKINFPKCQTVGVVNAMLPALPLNFFYRNGSPDMLYLSSKDQYEIFVKHLCWPKKKLSITDSIRLKKTINKNSTKKKLIYFPIELFEVKKLKKIFLIYFKENVFYCNKFQIKNHPQRTNSQNHRSFENELKKILLEQNNFAQKIDRNNNFEKNNVKLNFYIGCTTSFIENLVKGGKIIHMTLNPVLDCYSSKLWKNILIKPVSANIFKYRILSKNNIIRLSHNSFGLKTLRVL